MIKGLKLLFKILSIMISTFVAICIVLFMILPIFKFNPYVVLSASMEPAIKTGSVAWINLNDKDVEVGDIVTFELDEGIRVTHRIVNTDGEMFVTKGDNNETEDFVPVSKSQILGTYAFSIPGIGYVVQALQEKKAFALFSMLFLLAIILMDILLSNSENDGGVKNES